MELEKHKLSDRSHVNCILLIITDCVVIEAQTGADKLRMTGTHIECFMFYGTHTYGKIHNIAYSRTPAHKNLIKPAKEENTNKLLGGAVRLRQD